MPDPKKFIYCDLHDPSILVTATEELIANTKSSGETNESFLLEFSKIPDTTSTHQRINFAAHDGNLIIGLLTLVVNKHQQFSNRARLSRLITRSNYRRLGVAINLIHQAEVYAIQEGITIINFDTAVNDHVATLYTRAGFKIESIEPGFASLADGRLVDTVTYWKSIVK